MAALDSRLMVNGRTVTKKSASVGHSLHAAVTQTTPSSRWGVPFSVVSRVSRIFHARGESGSENSAHAFSVFSAHAKSTADPVQYTVWREVL